MNLSEVLKLAFSSLKTNRLRAALTILGIGVGIFSIILIMTVITMLQLSIENGVASLGKNTFQIQKFPAIRKGGHSGDAKYRNRKDITLEDYDRLKEMLKSAKYVGAEQWQFGKYIKFRNDETNPNVQVAGISLDAMKTNDWSIAQGRAFSEIDVERANSVVLLGNDVVLKLFSKIDPIGQTVRVDGQPMRVLGVIEKKGEMFGQSRDNFVILPITTFQSVYGKRSRSVNITVTSYGKEDYNEVIESTVGYMRTIRKVAAGEESDFEIFSNESILKEINNITEYVKIGAMVVSFISLLAAGIGIMNIMLVSVTERTREIGIRKAIGAKKINILAQFLAEAITLCIFGGLIGIGVGVGLGNLVGSFINAQSAIPYDWVIIGFGLCVFVGVLFGTYPAYKASNLDPIEALRFE